MPTEIPVHYPERWQHTKRLDNFRVTSASAVADEGLALAPAVIDHAFLLRLLVCDDQYTLPGIHPVGFNRKSQADSI